MNINWTKVTVEPNTTIGSALQILNEEPAKIVLVVDPQFQLIGVVSDGDIRRGLLAGKTLEQPIQSIMNKRPVTHEINDPIDLIAQKMQNLNLVAIPITDGNKLVGLKTIHDVLSERRPEKRENLVMIMAGGFGTRLKELTKDTPKPMLKIDGKPMLEVLIDRLVDQGFYRFCISTHFMSEKIMDYFGSGSSKNILIDYVHENEPLGTAGALGLLKRNLTRDLPFFVTNGDVLTSLNYSRLLEFHSTEQAAATMCIKSFEYQIPYGVVEFAGNQFSGIVEKPTATYSVNAGIYMLNPEVIDMIPGNTNITMPEIFEQLLDQGKPTSVFPIHEYWLDIGRPEEFRKAQVEIKEIG